MTVTLHDLIRWLALPYSAGSSPVFATQQADGTPLDTGREMKALYEEIMGGPVPTTPGAWWQCPACGMMQVQHVPLPADAPGDHRAPA